MSDNKGFDPNKAVDQIKSDRNLMIVAAGAIAAIVGLFLPWYTASGFGISVSASPGLSAPGIYILLAAVVAVGAGLNVLNQDKKVMNIVMIVTGAVAGLLVLTDSGSGLTGVSRGIGYWLTLAGSIAIAAGGIMRWMAEQNNKPSN